MTTINGVMRCAFCNTVLEEDMWTERGKLFCNEYCASDEEDPGPPQLELDLGED